MKIKKYKKTRHKRKIIVFDLDRTIVKCDIPIEAVRLYYKNFPSRNLILKKIGVFLNKLPFSRLKRIFEYFEISFIPQKKINKIIFYLIKEKINKKLLQKMKKYKRQGYEVYIVTAGPQKYLTAVKVFFKVKLIGSSVCLGIIINDLQGKKEKIYKHLIKNDCEICAIYSDQINDLSPFASENYLVNNKGDSHYKF
jgi:phosphoserine phosphatase